MDYGHPRLNTLFGLADGLYSAADFTLRAATKAYKKRTRQRRGGTIRPGTHTPLWNALATETRRLIKRYGEKANLGRFLGLPRQRVHQFLMEKSAGPDAERTLLLLVWVSAKRRGITKGRAGSPPARPSKIHPNKCHVIRDTSGSTSLQTVTY